MRTQQSRLTHLEQTWIDKIKDKRTTHKSIQGRIKLLKTKKKLNDFSSSSFHESVDPEKVRNATRKSEADKTLRFRLWLFPRIWNAEATSTWLCGPSTPPTSPLVRGVCHAGLSLFFFSFVFSAADFWEI